ncbi:glutathione S-transferase domain protein [Hyaloraphidium curvatum]|nr:glutathione S-transferase domain protein [Hyaloraphidium curvatum]
MSQAKAAYDLHYWPTPNGKKVTILLEEMGIKYNVVDCNIMRGDQFTPEFLKMNPNHRMPVLVDNEPLGGGPPVAIFESGAIMLYLAEKHNSPLLPSTPLAKKYEVIEWVVWQQSNQGPKTGECGHFRRLGDTKGDQSYAVTRFTDEVNRLYGVLNNRLFDRRFIAGDEISVADFACYPWTASWKLQGQDIAEFPYFARWQREMEARASVQKGMAVAPSSPPPDPANLSQEEKDRLAKMLYNQRARPAPAGGLL